ncbi:MAG: T9SS C-terminal target domain-containing protein [Bacteroidetes bacterium]|nr:MAG: T9SS C-terminal target domain-containing protein [Bacteroidota bacterium]
MILKNYIKVQYALAMLFVFALSALPTQQAMAQCPNDNIFFFSTPAPTTPGATVQVTSCIFGGEYITMTNMQAGATYRISTCGDTDFDTEITVYSAGGVFQVENDDACGLQSEVDFTPTVTGDYDILVDEWICSSNTICMTLNVTLIDTSPPANDDACNATPLTLGIPADINNEFATTQQFEPNPGPGTVGEAPTCNAIDGWCSFELDLDNTVWYTFVGPASGCVSVEIASPGLTDLQLAVYQSDNCNNYFKFKEVAANDDGGPLFVPFLDFFEVVPGLTYFVQVDGYNGDFGVGDQIIVHDGAGPVPAPWTTSHNGAAVGSFSYVTCGEVYTASSNQFATPFKDQGGYILQTMCGDGYVQARVDDIDGLGWAGITMRESNAQGSRKVDLKTQLNSLVRRVVRKGTNGFAQNQQYPRPQGWNWLRLERVGDQFAGYISEDGSSWQQIFASSFVMNNCLQVGMFVESINVNSVTTGTFSTPETGSCPCESSFGGSYDGAYCGASTGSPGFPDDPTCEAAVCAVDPFCCDISWDGLCAAQAMNDFAAECADCLSAAPAPTGGFGTLQSDITQPEDVANNVDRIGDLTVFPNPSQGVVNLQVEDFIGKSATVVIYTSLGQELYTRVYDVVEVSTLTIDLTSPKVASGIYHLNFVSEGQRITKQVIINKK